MFHFPWFDRSPERDAAQADALSKPEKCTQEGQKKGALPPELTPPELPEQEQSAPVSDPVHDDEAFVESVSDVEPLEDTVDAPPDDATVTSAARLSARRRGGPARLLPKAQTRASAPLTPAQRLLLLDTWQRSGLPGRDFAAMVGLSRHTLYAWKKRFAEQGPAGLAEQSRGAPRGSKLPELTRRTILMLKQSNPDWGCQRISDMLLRGPALPASPSTVARVLSEAGYEVQEEATRPHPDHQRRFERATANQLWQTDLFTFVLKR